MTVNLDYSFYGNEVLSIAKDNINKISRSVRTKLGLKDKLLKSYKGVLENSNVNTEVNRRPLDDTKENSDNLKVIIDKLISQNKVTHTPKRMALYTKPFKEKIENTFFHLFPLEEKKTELNTEVNAEVNNGGIPNTWENITEKELENVETKSEEPVEPNMNIAEVENEIPVEEPKIIDNNFEMPSLESIPTEAPSLDNTNISYASETPSLVPTPTEAPSLDNANISYASETPSLVSTPMEAPAEYDMPSFDFELSKTGAEMPFDNDMQVSAPSMENPEKKLSIEDKIASLLSKAKSINNEVPEMAPIDKKIPSQADVIAKVQKAKNLLKDKDTEIASLKAKIEEITDKYNTTKAKLDGYNAVIRDVTSKYDDTARNNDELSAKYDQLQESLNMKIASLEEQLKESQQLRNSENEKSRQVIADMKSQHLKEIEELTRKNNQKLQSLREEKDKQLKEAYNSILDVLAPTEEPAQKVA